ncbi:MAG: hypothetical protein ACE361_14075 [Aureliella sp.]
MEYILECSCGIEHRVTKKQAGQELPCSCGATVKIPTLRSFSDLRPAVNEGSASVGSSASKAEKSNSAWSGWRSPAIAFTVLVMLLAIAASGYWVLQATRNDLGVTNEDFIAGSKDVIANYGPNELSIAWDDFQRIGLKNRTPPTFHIYNVYVEQQWEKVRYGCIVAAVAAFLTAMIWVSSRFTKK